MSKTFLITGANRGIGFEMTRQVAKTGNYVIACSRKIDEAYGLMALAKTNPMISLLDLDVTAENKMKKVASSINHKIDILICNAGILNSYGGLEDELHDSNAIQDVLMTNVAGVFFTIRSFLPNLTKTDTSSGNLSNLKGKIAVISSIMGSQEKVGSTAPIYRASKAAATNLARSTAIELAPRGIAVGAYHPGWVRTDMGGSKATVSPEESAAGLLRRFDQLDLSNTGIFETYNGERIPF